MDTGSDLFLQCRCVSDRMHTHMHTHTEREREREREWGYRETLKDKTDITEESVGRERK